MPRHDFILGPRRTKIRTPVNTIINVPPTNEYQISDDSLVSTGPASTLTSAFEEEGITYTTRPPYLRNKSNFCRHYHVTTDYGGNPLLAKRLTWAVHGTYFMAYNYHTQSEAAHHQALTIAKAALGINIQDAVLNVSGQALINSSAERLRPDLTTISLPNFLLEIDDVTKLWHDLKKGLSIAKNLRRASGKDAAGLYLGYNFGLRPLKADLATIVSNLRSLTGKIEAFEKSLGKTIHGSTTALDDITAKSGTFSPFASVTCNWRVVCKRHATAHIVWRPQPLQVVGALDKTVRGLLDLFGFELNPRILWDALPFTFVIDWFFDVGSFLGRYKIDTMELPIMYVDSYINYSEEIITTSSVVVDATASGMTPVLESGEWFTVEKYFQRIPISPDRSTWKDLGASFPTAKQILLGLSLATVLGHK